MINLLCLLQNEGFQVTFASMSLETRQPYLSALQKQGIECIYRPYEDSVESHLRRLGARYQLVILSRLDTAAELMAVTRRFCPNAKVIFDTVDLHFLRVAREASLRRSARIERIARRIKAQELRLVAQADTTIVVSENEKALLAREAPQSDVKVVSNIVHINRRVTPFGQRRDILFVGGFAHPPNTDAVSFFCTEVLPIVLDRLPRVNFFVIGAAPPRGIARLATANVHILGYVPDIKPYLDGCRLSVAPLRFGAGVKGKINQSLAHGLPVVATSLAAEGMFLINGNSALIADDARHFGVAVVRLYQDERLWQKLSEGGLRVMEEHFSFGAAEKAIRELVAA
jgi:glycosyltransferase involved in cell wall biosynthesis